LKLWNGCFGLKCLSTNSGDLDGAKIRRKRLNFGFPITGLISPVDFKKYANRSTIYVFQRIQKYC